MKLFGIILSINVIDISRQTIYGAYLNENFYLIKINKPPPKKYYNAATISSVDYIFKNCQEYTN